MTYRPKGGLKQKSGQKEKWTGNEDTEELWSKIEMNWLHERWIELCMDKTKSEQHESTQRDWCTRAAWRNDGMVRRRGGKRNAIARTMMVQGNWYTGHAMGVMVDEVDWKDRILQCLTPRVRQEVVKRRDQWDQWIWQQTDWYTNCTMEVQDVETDGRDAGSLCSTQWWRALRIRYLLQELWVFNAAMSA